MQEEKSCGALVYRRRNNHVQILLLKHCLGKNWSFPKGHVEPGEREGQTAIREVREETGLVVGLFPHFRHCVEYNPKPNVHKRVVYFLAYVRGGTLHPQEGEIRELRWVDLRKAEQMVAFSNDRKLIRQARRRLGQMGLLPKRTKTPAKKNVPGERANPPRER